MKQLKHLLLTGTMVPALVFALVPASAQAPDPNDRHKPGQHQGGGGGGGGGDRGPRGGGGGMQGGGGNGGMQGQGGRPQADRLPGGGGGGMQRRDANQGGAPAVRPRSGDAGNEPRRLAPHAPVPSAAARADETPRARKSNPVNEVQRAGQPNLGAAPDQALRREDRAKNKMTGEQRRLDRENRAKGPADNALRKDPDAPRRVGDGDNRRKEPGANALRKDPEAPRRLGDGDNRRGPGNDALRNEPDPTRRVGGGDDRRGPGNDALRNEPDPTRRVGGGDNRRGPGNDALRNEPNAPRRAGNDEGRNGQDRDGQGRNDRRLGPTGVVIGAGIAAGIAGAFLAPTGARRLDDLRRDRREVRDGDRTFIREPGRTIVQEGGRAFIVHDENDRFRALGLDVRRERRGNTFVDTANRPGGIQILTFTDITGRLLRRVRRTADGREFVLIDNGNAGRIQRYEDDVIDLPPPPMRIPRDRYVVDYRDADEGLLYDTLTAPPLAAPPRRYTLDQVRYSPDIRNYVRSVDINTINFDTGSWDVPAAATGLLRSLGSAIKRAVDRDPNSVFLVEGYTDATGNPDDNLSLSDRRAQSVAEILTKSFGVPPENLTTQGYGQQNLKENTQGPSAVNRRVVVQNITQLLSAGTPPTAEQ